MKILYVGTFDRRSVDKILALDTVGAQISCRRVDIGEMLSPLPDRIKELSKVSFATYDVCIQQVPNDAMDYDGRVGLNVGMADCPPSISTPMDVLIVQDIDIVSADISLPFRSVPQAIDVTRYERSFKESDTIRRNGRFLFYTIGELTRDQNLSGLLRAFHAEFRPHEPVGLVIVPSLTSTKPERARKCALAICSEIKRGMGLAEYIEEDIVDRPKDDEALLSLHYSCDCFVKPTYGMVWDNDTIDAAALGKTPIITDWGVNRIVAGWPVRSRSELAFGSESMNGRQKWRTPDLGYVRQYMRWAYEDSVGRKERAARGIERAYRFSYDCVGNQLLKVLKDELQAKTRNRGS